MLANVTFAKNVTRKYVADATYEHTTGFWFIALIIITNGMIFLLVERFSI